MIQAACHRTALVARCGAWCVIVVTNDSPDPGPDISSRIAALIDTPPRQARPSLVESWSREHSGRL